MRPPWITHTVSARRVAGTGEPSSVFTRNNAMSGLPSGGAAGWKSRHRPFSRVRTFPPSARLVGADARSAGSGSGAVGPVTQPDSMTNVHAATTESERIRVPFRELLDVSPARQYSRG